MNSVHSLSWALWLGGTALIVASWVDLVASPVGWIGFGVAAAGTRLSSFNNRLSGSHPVRQHPFSPCKTCLLHQSHECRRPERPNATTCPESFKM
jgi:hypothetical protein